MGVQLTGHIVLEIDGDEQQIEAESFIEEHAGVWKYYRDGYVLMVTANLDGAVNDDGHYPTFVEEPEMESGVSVEIVESDLAAARGDAFEIDDDAEEADQADVDDEDEH